MSNVAHSIAIVAESAAPLRKAAVAKAFVVPQERAVVNHTMDPQAALLAAVLPTQLVAMDRRAAPVQRLALENHAAPRHRFAE